MQKPKSLRILAAVASVFIIVDIIINICAYFNPETVFNLFVYESVNLNPDIPSNSQILFIISYFRMIPLLAVCVTGFLTKKVSFIKGVLSVVLAGFMYILGSGVSNMLSNKALQLASVNGKDTLALLSVLSNVKGMLSFMNTAALVLICCACAVEIYITRNQAKEI